jgi:hypothetical protein
MADRYWVGGAATWDSTAGTKWSLTSGGAGGQTVPSSADNVFFNAASGTVTITISGTRSCANFNCTGFIGTLAGTSTPQLLFSGTVVTLSAGMTVAVTGPTFSPNAAVSTAFTTNGNTVRALTVATVGCTVTLQDNLTCAGLLTAAGGTFDANDFNVSATGFTASGTFARTISMGNGAWTIGGSTTAALWDTTTTTNLTYNAEGATITFNPSTIAAYTISTGNLAITNAITILAMGSNSARISMTGTGALSSLTVTGQNRIFLNGNSVINSGNFDGTPTANILISSSAPGTARTITASGSITGKYVVVQDMTKAGAGTIVFLPGVDLGNNTDITLNPRTPRAQYRLGA